MMYKHQQDRKNVRNEKKIENQTKNKKKKNQLPYKVTAW